MNLGQPNYAESNDQTPLLPSENSKRRQRRSVKKPKLNVSTTKVEAPLPLEKYRLLGQQNNPASGAGNNIKRDRHPLLSGSNEVRESVTQEESSAAKPKKNIRSSYVPMGSQLKEPRGNCKRPGAHLSLEYSTKVSDIRFIQKSWYYHIARVSYNLQINLSQNKITKICTSRIIMKLYVGALVLSGQRLYRFVLPTLSSQSRSSFLAFI